MITGEITVHVTFKADTADAVERIAAHVERMTAQLGLRESELTTEWTARATRTTDNLSL